MAAPTFVAVGTFTAAAGAITPPIPAGAADGDLCILAVETANQAITVSGWTEVPSSPQGTGTAGAAGGVRITAFYKFFTTGMGNPTTSDSGDHQAGAITVWRGVDTTTPIEASAGTNGAATNTPTLPSLTTLTDDALVVYLLAGDRDIGTSETQLRNAEWTSSSLDTGFATEVDDEFTATNSGGGVSVAHGTMVTAGVVSAGTARFAGTNSMAYGVIALALKPTAAGGSDNLTSSNVATGTPSIDQQTLTQTQVLTASNITTSAPAIAAQTLTQGHVFASLAVATSAPAIQTQAIAIVTALSPQNIATPTPAITLSVMTQAHALTAQALATSTPQIPAASLTQGHVLQSTNIATSAPAIAQQTLNVTRLLTSLAVTTSAPAIAAATIGQRHALSALAVSTTAPQIPAATLTSGTITVNLAAQNIATSTPAIGSSSIAQAHALQSQAIATTAPSISAAVLFSSAVQNLVSQHLTTPLPSIGQISCKVYVVVPPRKGRLLISAAVDRYAETAPRSTMLLSDDVNRHTDSAQLNRLLVSDEHDSQIAA